jgi:hypothetical protein
MPRVFISYSQDSASHIARILALARDLRELNLHVVIDQDMLPGGPDEGWELWSEAQVRDADFVLLACTEAYSRRYDSNELPDKGLGAVFEAGVIRALIYKSSGINEKFRVILFSDSDKAHIPLSLERYHRFPLYHSNGRSELDAWLSGKHTASLSSLLCWPTPAQSHNWDLADRKEITALLERMLTDQSSHRILLLRAPSNSGKTHLLAEMRAYAHRLHLPCSLLDLKGCPSLDELFEIMRIDFGPDILRTASSSAGAVRFFNLISDLRRLTAPLLLIFDTWEQASAESQTWVETQLLPRLDRAPGVVVVIAGQAIAGRSQSWARLTAERTLEPIRRPADWAEYTSRRWQGSNISLEYIEALVFATDGNPGQLSALLESMVRRMTGR